MRNYATIALTAHSSDDDLELQMSQQPRCNRWAGRIVTYCPGGYYTDTAYRKVTLILQILATLTFGTLLFGFVLGDYMGDTKELIVVSVASTCFFSTIFAYSFSYFVFRLQHPRAINDPD